MKKIFRTEKNQLLKFIKFIWISKAQFLSKFKIFKKKLIYIQGEEFVKVDSDTKFQIIKKISCSLILTLWATNAISCGSKSFEDRTITQ